MNTQLSAASVAPAATDQWLTAGTLTMIAIGVVLALLVIVWGARLKRQRKAVDLAIEERIETAATTPATPAPPVEAVAVIDAALPPVPETDPVPVAPAPPPLGDAPVVATAPMPPAPPTPTAADDLTLLKGVGPKLAARLRDLGVDSFAQIAALSPSDAATLDAQLGSFQGRMIRDRWVEQAAYLARDDRAGFESAFGKL
jgi:predicted flap endonuclease-1-like 5' DNA nuclease